MVAGMTRIRCLTYLKELKWMYEIRNPPSKELNRAIAWLENERNSKAYTEASRDPAVGCVRKGWLLK
jgi:hypothetical protein